MKTVKLSHASNPDIGGYWGCPVDPRKAVLIQVDSIMEASKVCREYIDRNELGSGNWTGGAVFDNGKHVANVSFNGRVWGINGEELTA